MITKSLQNPIVLSSPCLTTHNPMISSKEGEHTSCPNCFKILLSPFPKQKPWRTTFKNHFTHHGWVLLCREKKHGDLQPCVDYQGLKSVTINYPLLLLPSALEQVIWEKYGSQKCLHPSLHQRRQCVTMVTMNQVTMNIWSCHMT